MERGATLDKRLVCALSEGGSALPEEPALLAPYLRMIRGLLAEKAGELEPSWELALEAAAEIEALQALELAVIEKAVRVRAATLNAVICKFAVWHALGAGEEETARDGLARSIAADVARIARERGGA